MSVLYIEPFSGLGGDMLLSALCGLCDAYEEVVELPERLKLPDGRVQIETVNKNGIVCKHVKIVDLNEHRGGSGQGHVHAGDNGHAHAHSHSPHRHLSQIHELIDRGEITERAKSIAKGIFQIIGESESKIHGIPLEKIHFHEVSAVDSILDIVGCAVMLDMLDISKTYADPICVGGGTVKTDHGVLPVPAPATADILMGMPTFKGPEGGEKTTPTGAAVLKYLQPEFANPTMRVQKTAYGPGTKDFKVANVVRLSIVEVAEVTSQDEMYIVETQVDDMTGEALGFHWQEQLQAVGASDFFFTPIQMKKGRPALKISALASKKYLDAVCEYLLEQTSTIGLRYYKTQKVILPRDIRQLETPHGGMQVKEVTKPSGRKQTKIEHDSIVEISKKLNKSLLETQELLRPLMKE